MSKGEDAKKNGKKKPAKTMKEKKQAKRDKKSQSGTTGVITTGPKKTA